MVAGFFVAAFVAVEPAFQIVLVGGVFHESQRVEVFRRQIADDVDTRRRTAIFVPAANLVAGAGASGGSSRFAEHGQRQLIDILILRADLRIVRVLPLLGLGDIVVFLGRIRRQQRIRLFAAFGKFAITEDKGLSGHGVGGGRLNVPIIVDGELRGLYGMMLLLAEYADRMPIVGIQKTLRRRHSRTGGNPEVWIYSNL